MFLYNRLNQIFISLYRKEYVTQKELATHHDVSSRTIRNDITQLNDELHRLDSQIILERGKGYHLQGRETLQSVYEEIQGTFHHLESTTERVQELLALLLFSKDYLSLEELCDRLYVGRTTLLNYMRQVKDLLADYDLQVKTKTNIGYLVMGEEVQIRECIAKELIPKEDSAYITSFTKEELKLFPSVDLEEISEKVMEHFPPDTFHLSDLERKNFIVHVSISLLRVQSGATLGDDFPHPPSVDMSVNLALEAFIDFLEERFHVPFPIGEKRWIYSHFIAGIPSQKKHEEADLLTTQLMKHLSTFDNTLSRDTLLKQNLLQHFSTYLPAKEMLKDKKNPLLATIKQAYSYAFHMTYLAMEQTSYSFTEDEIGYVTLHVAASLERNKQKKKILLVCGQGASTSRLVETVLQKEVGQQVEVVATLSYAAYRLQGVGEADLIVSTIPIEVSHVPVIQIDFLSLRKGVEEIKKLLRKNTFRNDWTSLFHESRFLIGGGLTKEACIAQMSASKAFAARVLAREKLAPTNISPLIAIPHAVDETLEHSAISVYISENPIDWNQGESVQIIFFLAIADADKEKLEVFFEQLYEWMSDGEKERALLEVRSYEAFLETWQAGVDVV